MIADSTVPSRASKSQSGEPRWWTVVVPGLLTLPVAGWGLLLGALAGLSSGDGGPDPGPIPVLGVAEFIVGVVTVGMLIAALAWRPGRRALRRILWACCLLACTGLAVMFAWTAAHP